MESLIPQSFIKFSKDLIPDNRDQFNIVRDKRRLCYLRKEITDLILGLDENDFLNLDDMRKKYYKASDGNQIIEDIELLMKELDDLGWRSKLARRKTALFVYKDQAPESAWV